MESILQFSQHGLGLEKYNDVMTKEYFRSTSHHGEAALRQIMEKQNRLEHLSDLGSQTKKCFSIVCSNCGGSVFKTARNVAIHLFVLI